MGMKGKLLVIKPVFHNVMFHTGFFFHSHYQRRVLENEKENRKHTALYGYGSISVRRLRIHRIYEHIGVRLFVFRIIGGEGGKHIFCIQRSSR